MLQKNDVHPCWLVFVALLFVVTLGGCNSGSPATESPAAPAAVETPASNSAQPLAPQTGKATSLPADIDTATLEMLRELRDHWTKTNDTPPNPNSAN